jgi:uncharacterized membrane protein HdeD (DUF308 family)
MTSSAVGSSPSSSPFFKNRFWLIAGGLLSISVGFVAITIPYFFTIVIAQFLGIFALVSGVIALGLALFGQHTTHRVLGAFSALVRIAAGIILLLCLASSIAVITLIFAAFLVVEGIFAIGASLKLRGTSGWVWTLINGLAALALGVMIYHRWPGDSLAVLGLFYGIYSLFTGISYLMLGLAGTDSKPAKT